MTEAGTFCWSLLAGAPEFALAISCTVEHAADTAHDCVRSDTTLTETVIGLNKTETIYHLGPRKGLDDVEFTTLEWVAR